MNQHQLQKKLKVIHVASGDLWGGAEAQLFTLAKELGKRQDVDVVVILMNDKELASRLRALSLFPVVVIDESSFNSFSILIALLRLFKVHRPNIVHTHGQKENVLASIANKLRGGGRCLRTQHGAAEFEYTWGQPHKKFFVWLDLFCGRTLQQKVVSVSNELTSKLSAHYQPQQLETIENGVDFESLLDLEIKAPFRLVDPDKCHIGIVGRLVAVKRVDLFLRTARLILNKQEELGASFVFHIIGDGPLRGEIVKLRDSLGLASHVNLHGHVDNVACYINSLDLLLMTSDHEGLPMTALEAMAMKVPIVSHNIGALKPVLEKGIGGALSSSHCAESYLDSVERVLLGGSHRYAEKGFEVVKSKFSSSRNAERMMGVYRDLQGS